MRRNRLAVPKKKLAEFCRRHYIRRFSLFGSILSTNFHSRSDIDVLVEFQKGCTPGYFEIADMEMKLARLMRAGKRKVDMRTPEELSKYFRADVLKRADVQYVHR